MSDQVAIAEAKHLVAALALHAGRMNLLDQRYIETWQLYLKRCGDQAQVNERRLTWLRNLWREYAGGEVTCEAA